MAKSYLEFKRRVALMLDRDDTTEQITYDNQSLDMLDIFADDAQKRFYRDECSRTPPFEFVQRDVVVEAGASEIPIPQGYLELRYAEINRGDVRHLLERTSAEQILNSDTSARVHVPCRIAYGSNKFLIDKPSADLKMDIYYYGELGQFRDVEGESESHWLLNLGDDLIAYWAAAEGARYYDSMFDRIDMFEARAEEIRMSIIKQDKRARQSGSTPRIGRHYRNAPRISPSLGTTGARR